MIQKHRINTEIGNDKTISVEINQKFDLLEILSLKFTQQEAYTSLCADYGVVCGRIIVNNGFGIPNARVSVFVPIKDQDTLDPVISALYPYQTSEDSNADGYRYNLLPARKQHGGHVPTGTFFDQEDILSREEVLEVFDSYYRYTVKTNSAGDFMIWGVPLGEQVLHVDVDLSDMGCFSLRPYDFIRQGRSENIFDRFYNFKNDSDLDGLPQIVSFDKTIEVAPFWGNMDLCQIGINRCDFDLSNYGIKVDPVSLVLVSSVTDNNGDAVKRSGVIRRKTGYKCNLETSEGKIEGVRYTGNKVISSDGVTIVPELEYFTPGMIDEDGAAMAVIQMNMDYTYTNEFGEQEISNDPNKGIATTTVARFRMSLNGSNNTATKGTHSAHYLVPNIREFNKYSGGGNGGNGSISGEYSEAMISSYCFSNVFEDYYKTPLPAGLTLEPLTTLEREHKKELMLGVNNDDIPEDYFYKFIYGKVYTPTSFQGSHYEVSAAESFFGLSRRDAFLGIKEIRPNSEDDCSGNANYIPTNFGFKNRIKFSLLIAQVILFLQFVVAIILNFVYELIGGFLYTIGRALYAIYFGWPFKWRPFEKIGEQFQDAAYKLQTNGTQTLPLTIYPDCEECTNDAESVATSVTTSNQFCSIGEIKFKVLGISEGRGNVILIPIDINLSTDPGTSWVSDGQPARDYDPLDPYLSLNTFIITGSTKSATVSNLESLDSYTITPDPGDTNNRRFIGDVISVVDDTVIPYSSANGDTETKSISFSGFLINFGSEPTEASFKPNSFGLIESISWPTDGKYGASFISDWINFLGDYPGPGVINGITFNHDTFGEISGFNYTGYEGGKNGEGNFADRGTYAIMRIIDRSKLKSDPNASGASEISIEQGCEKYDKSYDESTSFKYLWATSSVPYGSTYEPINPPTGYASGLVESKTSPGSGYAIVSDIIADSGAVRCPRFLTWGKIGNTYYDRKTKSGYSEIRDGVFTVIPVIRGGSRNYKMIIEWYRRKRVGVMFCGGILNYSYADNWLHGLLYFFKFDFRIKWDNSEEYDINQRGSKFPRELVFYNVLDQKFYYRSTPYNPTTKRFIGQSYSGYKELLHPTTMYDVGVRDEFFDEICFDPRVDPNCSVIRDITVSSYQDPANILEHTINFRMDASQAKIDIDDFFSGVGMGSNMKVLDGDVRQLMSINCEAGIEAFDLDSTHYFIYNGEFMDPEDPTFSDYFGTSPNWGPTPIDFKLDQNGRLVRLCLNNRLGDYTQAVPMYLWDKKSTGFGTADLQQFDRNNIATQKLQRMVSIGSSTSTTTNYLMADGEEEYLIKPMTKDHATYFFEGNYTDMLERFEIITLAGGSTPDPVIYVEGDLWLEVLTHGPTGFRKDPYTGNIYVLLNGAWSTAYSYISNVGAGNREVYLFETVNNYSGNKQVLSTPFHFYFGLRPGSTSYDKFIKYYGPKGAFTSGE